LGIPERADDENDENDGTFSTGFRQLARPCPFLQSF